MLNILDFFSTFKLTFFQTSSSDLPSCSLGAINKPLASWSHS